MALLILTNLNTLATFAQDTEECGGAILFGEYDEGGFRSNVDFCTDAVKVLPIVIHVVYSGTLEQAQVDIGMTEITENFLFNINRNFRTTNSVINEFVDTKIQFALAGLDPEGNETDGVNYVYDADSKFHYYNNSTDFANEVYRFEAMALWDISKYINIWIVSDIVEKSVYGFALNGRGIYLDYASFGSNTPTHELGHMLGLKHTYEAASCNEVNCTSEGDFICDTPPGVLESCDFYAPSCGGDLFPHVQLSNFMSACPQRTNFTFGQALFMTDVLHNTVISNEIGILNFKHLWSNENLAATGVVAIDYNFAEAIIDHINPSQSQTVVMTVNGDNISSIDWSWSGGNATGQTLSYTEDLTITSRDFMITTTFNDGKTRTDELQINFNDAASSDYNFQFENNIWSKNILITADETWHNHLLRINGKIIIESGATLTLDGGYFEFSPQGGIIVKPGGKLIAYGYENYPVTFRGKRCDNTPWQGIQIEGNYTNCQDVTDPACQLSGNTDLLTHHGIVELNNATIQDAKIGVQVGKPLVVLEGNVLSGGGGLLTALDSNFDNCSVGVEFNPYNNIGLSSIANSDFNITAPFLGTHTYTNLGYIGVYTNEINSVSINGNTFKNHNPQAFDLDKQGCGIITNNSNMSIGDNNFSALYKGITGYGLNALQSMLSIVGNNFYDNTYKGITLNGNSFSAIEDNNFTLSNADGNYGVYTLLSTGLKVTGNTFNAPEAATETNFKYGLVMHNSGTMGAAVLENVFGVPDNTNPNSNKPLRAGVQIEGGSNQLLTIDCNVFNAQSKYDLRIFDFLQDQGACDFVSELLNPNANDWHTPPQNGSTYHIYYSNAQIPFNITYANGYEPTLLSGNINTYDCADDETDCTFITQGGGTGAAKIAYLQNLQADTTLTPAQQTLITSELLRTHISLNQFSEAETLLTTSNLNQALTATQTLQGQYSQALATLDLIPQDTPDNIAFHEFFTNYIEERQNTGGSGKTTQSAQQNLTKLADKNLLYPPDLGSLMAQTHTAISQKTGYNRIPVEVKKQNETTQHTTSNLLVYPNPANNELYITANPIMFAQAEVSLYTANGQEVAKVKMVNGQANINTAQLHPGIYISQVSNGIAAPYAKFTIFVNLLI